MPNTDLPPDVTALFDVYVAGLRDVFSENLLGVYTRGSLAIGDFDPAYSDIDLLVVTHRPVSEDEFEALRQLHDRIRQRKDRFSESLEAAYLDAESARRFVAGQQHATITSHEPLRWELHDSNWVLDRWQSREHGDALFGPFPREVFDAISDDDLRAAARRRLIGWGKWASQVPAKDDTWFADRAHQAYVIETMCRGLHTLNHPGLPTKPQAVAWALTSFPEHQRSLVKRSREWRMQKFDDAATAAETLDFVRWAAAKAREV